MLYDDAGQIEVRYVISLAHHDVSISGARDDIPENELYTKRNAICLTRKPSIPEPQAPQNSTLPFYLFSENLSEKEDFYFAIINNLETVSDSPDAPPTPEHFHANNMVTLIRRLHSSEDHLQTRWINALIGRLFLALYKTEQLEEFLWKKISKKISRVQKPNFITQVALQKIDAGEGAPLITNPRLKDLNVDGDCCIEADIDYSGNFRIQVAATARIDLGSRIKAREVDLVLAAVLKKLKGRVLLRVKPPPSNRLWVSFETMPTMEMAIEPIVSTRQITYGIIRRAIENRIREVVAETLVQPFWDDIPFLDTTGQQVRGGIWHREARLDRSTVIPDEAGESQEPPVVQASSAALAEHGNKEDETTPKPAEMDGAVPSSDHARRKSSNSLPTDAVSSSSSAAVDNKISRPDSITTPTVRPRTFSHVADPVLKADPINANHASLNGKSYNKDATSEMIKISGRSQPNSPASSPISSPPTRLATTTTQNKPPKQSESTPELGETLSTGRPRAQSSCTKMSSSPPAPVSEGSSSISRLNSSDSVQQGIVSDSKKPASTKSTESRQTVNAIGTAAAAAKKWGINVFNRTEQPPPPRSAERPAALDQPMGRGLPLPPPGIPLPPPDRSSFSVKSASTPKRKPVPPPPLPGRPPHQVGEEENSRTVLRRPVPKRPSVSSSNTVEEPCMNDDLMVIEAPQQNSEPGSPVGKEASAPAPAPAPDSASTSSIPDDATSASSVPHTETSADIEKKLA